ncbi:MAG TPA: hypothetical protein DCP57_08705 [Gammaproteobacteria bacterium]|nr:hypothetical protein [Gammaproteobacteria bacterium]
MPGNRISPKRVVLGGRQRTRQGGQAMAEFLVSVAFVFMPLFVFVPLLGKVIDIQHHNQMAARYAAWERTVWFDNLDGENRDDFRTSGSEWESVALRSQQDVANTMKNRFFRNVSGGELSPILDLDTSLGDGEGSEVWRYVQSKGAMYDDTRLLSYQEQDTPGYAYGATQLFADGIQTVKEPINFLLGAIGNDNEDLFAFPLFSSPKGYFTPMVRTQLDVGNAHGGGSSVWDRENGQFSEGIESAIFLNWDGVLESNAAILADGWGAQSVAHYQDRADDYVPSDVFDNAFFDAVITIMSVLEGGPENSAINKLGFGDVSVEPMPMKDGEPAGVDCPSGICNFEE